MDHDFVSMCLQICNMMQLYSILYRHYFSLVRQKRGKAREQIHLFLRLARQNTSLFNELLQRVDELQQSVYSPNRGSEEFLGSEGASGQSLFFAPFNHHYPLVI